MSAALFALVGASAGALHALLLRRAVRARAHSLVGAFVRLAATAAALVAAALVGQLVAGALGWAAGFAIAAQALARRWS